MNKSFYLIFLCTLFSCNNSDFFNPYTTYDLEASIDSVGTSASLNSQRLDQAEVTWKDDIMSFTGSDENIQVKFKLHTKTKFLINYDFGLTGIAKNSKVKEVNLVSYTGNKGKNHRILFTFNQFFNSAMTTNTTTSTVTYPGEMEFTIVE